MSGEQREVSLNASEWDTHVSFTVLSLSPSPCGRYLLAATDKARLIVYRMGTNTIVSRACRALVQHSDEGPPHRRTHGRLVYPICVAP